MAGRKPRTEIDTRTNHMSKDEIKRRKDHTPVYEKHEFKPPEDLSKAELEIWMWLKSIFDDTYNCAVSDADVHLMELYCRAKAAADEADRQIKADPRPYQLVITGYTTGPDGKTKIPKTTNKANPWYKIRRDESALCLKLFDQLGLTPIARARVGLQGAAAQKDTDIWVDLMNRSDD